MAKTSADATTAKMFTENTVAVLLMALGNTSISTAQYGMMSALDGEKTASSFQHQFRSVLKKAKELKARADDGETFAAVAPDKKRAASAMDSVLTPPHTPKKPRIASKPRAKKAAKKGASESPNNDQGIVEDDEDFSFVKTEKQEMDDFC